MLIWLNSFPGRTTILSPYGEHQIVKAIEGRANVQLIHNEFSVAPPNIIDLKVHIHAETQTIEWELNGVRLHHKPPLPFPPPIFLVYQSGDEASEIVSEKM